MKILLIWSPSSSTVKLLTRCLPKCQTGPLFLKSENNFISCVFGCQVGEEVVTLPSYGGMKAYKKMCDAYCEYCDSEEFRIKC